MTRLLGRPAPRIEDPDLLLGKGRFVDDIRLPSMLHAAFVRSPHPHAAIRGIDATAARARDGVHAVYTFADLRPHLRGERLVVALPSAAFRQQVDRPVLAIDEVVHVGEAVAVVIAADRYIAEDAAVAIEVDYEPLPAAVDCRDALAANAPPVHRAAAHNLVAEFDLRFGDVAAAFDRAPHVFAQSLWQERGGSHSIECRGCVAGYDELEDRLTLWSSTQTPHAAMRMIADMLGRDEGRVRVVSADLGGGFGPKLVFYSEELVTSLAALLLRRPVKWIEDRREHFVATTQERGQFWQLEIATESDGRIRGVRGVMVHDHGAYTARGINVAFEAAQTMTMAYQVPACDLNVKLALTNKVPVTPVRGAGQPQGVFAMERLLDRVARKLNIDRAELRQRNLVRPDQMPYAKPFKTRSGIPVTIDSGDLPASQRAAMQAIAWNDFEQKRRDARQDGRFLGIGLANFVELTGRGPYEPATVRIDGSGKVLVSSSATAMGQGTKTMLAQIVAEQLGGDIANVVVTTGDSATSTTGFGGFGSRQAVTAGSSAHVAAVKVRAKALAIAAHLLEAAEEDLEIDGCDIRVKGAPGLKVGLAQVARASVGVAGALLPAGLPPGMEASEHVVIDQMTYSHGTAAAVVEVDVETGQVIIRDLVLAHDCGRVINPTIVAGQMMGGLVHGIGNALLERMVFDAQGQPMTTTLAEYLLPAAVETPSMRLLHRESPTPLNPLGIKGVGEGGVLPTPATIIAAVEDALVEFGVRIGQVPISPADIVAMIAAAREASAST
ncbi:MAG: xanthine dehydrogenase family protein molybdopterin-binding subunit [Hyphomicrobiales bacterium]|nr:xanthine dehydrogenase family protein molybdopterin-binding subunit [Hyphomicrobiales bacterium]